MALLRGFAAGATLKPASSSGEATTRDELLSCAAVDHTVPRTKAIVRSGVDTRRLYSLSTGRNADNRFCEEIESHRHNHVARIVTRDREFNAAFIDRVSAFRHHERHATVGKSCCQSSWTVRSRYGGRHSWRERTRSAAATARNAAVEWEQLCRPRM